MNRIAPLTLATLLSALPQTGLTMEASLLQGCYFSQSREVGEWVTTTAALYIEKTDDGILLHGSESNWKNRWLSTPDGESPVPLKKVDNQYIYEGELSSPNSYNRCELVLSANKNAISIKKFDRGCAKNWDTGDGIGPSKVKFTDKQPNNYMCLSYLGISDKADAASE